MRCGNGVEHDADVHPDGSRAVTGEPGAGGARRSGLRTARAVIAAAHFISVRYLHKLFAPEGDHRE